MAVDKSRLLQSLKKDLTASQHIKKQWDVKRLEWSKQYNADPYGNEVEGKSKIVSADIKSNQNGLSLVW